MCFLFPPHTVSVVADVLVGVVECFLSTPWNVTTGVLVIQNIDALTDQQQKFIFNSKGPNRIRAYRRRA